MIYTTGMFLRMAFFLNSNIAERDNKLMRRFLKTLIFETFECAWCHQRAINAIAMQNQCNYIIKVTALFNNSLSLFMYVTFSITWNYKIVEYNLLSPDVFLQTCHLVTWSILPSTRQTWFLYVTLITVLSDYR